MVTLFLRCARAFLVKKELADAWLVWQKVWYEPQAPLQTGRSSSAKIDWIGPPKSTVTFAQGDQSDGSSGGLGHWEEVCMYLGTCLAASWARMQGWHGRSGLDETRGQRELSSLSTR